MDCYTMTGMSDCSISYELLAVIIGLRVSILVYGTVFSPCSAATSWFHQWTRYTFWPPLTQFMGALCLLFYRYMGPEGNWTCAFMIQAPVKLWYLAKLCWETTLVQATKSDTNKLCGAIFLEIWDLCVPMFLSQCSLFMICVVFLLIQSSGSCIHWPSNLRVTVHQQEAILCVNDDVLCVGTITFSNPSKKIVQGTKWHLIWNCFLKDKWGPHKSMREDSHAAVTSHSPPPGLFTLYMQQKHATKTCTAKLSCFLFI